MRYPTSKSIAVVIPWFGRDLKGGAEQLAWQVAERLSGRGYRVEVLTTCCRAFQENWADNHLPAGVTKDGGFSIRRFEVEPRNVEDFDRINGLLLSRPPDSFKPGVSPLSPEDESVFAIELIKSTALLRYLKKQGESYDAFIFIPYLYGPTLNGLPLVAERAFLQPCLHDEAYAYLDQTARAFYLAKGILFNSEGEALLARRLYGPSMVLKSTVVGSGVEVADTAAAESANGSFPFDLKSTPYVLYLGRKDPGKGTDLLRDAYARFRHAHANSRLKLVFAGHGQVNLTGLESHAFDLGLVGEAEKSMLLANCRALFQASRNESFSRVVMEAWRNDKPVAVHADCLATSEGVRRCGGGWLARSEEDWSEVFHAIDSASEPELQAKGRAGGIYARDIADWERVIDRYESALFGAPQLPCHPAAPVSGSSVIAVHQVLPNLAYGDAISTHARWIRRQLRGAGYASEIFARYIDPQVADECHPFTAGCIQPADAILYHHSIASELTPHVVAHPGPKCLIYHNITPAEFFEPFRPELAQLLRKGREDLKLLARHFPVSVGDSAYNASELQGSGFVNPGVLSICVDPAKWNFAPDPALMDELQGNGTNLLFVGRISPQKKQEDLIRVFRRYLEFEPTARLHLVGGTDAADPYLSHLCRTADSLGLNGQVSFAGHVNEAQLAAYYRTADLFWSMSEHEGFCVPLVEAMWFDIPILAFKSTATPETLGPAGLLFNTKQDEESLAALAHVLVGDQELRRKLLSSQHGRRSEYLPTAVAPRLFSIVKAMTHTGGKP